MGLDNADTNLNFEKLIPPRFGSASKLSTTQQQASSTAYTDQLPNNANSNIL